MLKNPIYERLDAKMREKANIMERPTLGVSVAFSRLRALLACEAFIVVVNRETGTVTCGADAIELYHEDRSISYAWWYLPAFLCLSRAPGTMDTSDLCHWRDMGWGCELIGRSGRNSMSLEQTILGAAWVETINEQDIRSQFEGK